MTARTVIQSIFPPKKFLTALPENSLGATCLTFKVSVETYKGITVANLCRAIPHSSRRIQCNPQPTHKVTGFFSSNNMERGHSRRLLGRGQFFQVLWQLPTALCKHHR